MNSLYIRLLTPIIILDLCSFAYADQTDQVCSDNLTQGLIKLGENSDDPELKRRSLELKQSCEVQRKAAQKLAASQEELEILKEAQKVMAQLPDRDMYQEVLERSVKELKKHPHDVARMMERDDPKIRAIFNKMVREENQKLLNEIRAKRFAQKKIREKKSTKESK